MTSQTLIKSHIIEVQLSDPEKQVWTAALHNQNVGFREHGPYEEFIAESSVLAAEPVSSPDIAEGLKALKDFSINALVIKNLPEDDTLPAPPVNGFRPANKGSMSESMLLALMSRCAEPYGYKQEKGGRLVHEVAPVPGLEATQSNAGRDAFAAHIDNSFLHYEFRPTYLALIGNVNEKKIPTLIYELESVLARLDSQDLAELYKPNYRIRCPQSFGFRSPLWVEKRPLIELVNGHIVGGFNHNFNTEPTTPDASRAYAALCSAIDELDSEGPTEVVIEPGTALIFNNCRVLHARRAIESGSRWLQRVYGTANLEAMQAAAGSEGPIFDALRFL